MPISLIPSFLIYCFVGAITPGPANLCSLGAALRYGRGPALRQWRGLFCGFIMLPDCICIRCCTASFITAGRWIR